MERQGAVVWCGTGGVLVMKYILFVFIGFAMFILPYTGDAAIIGAKAETHRSDYMSMQVNRNIPSGAKKYAGHYYFVYANICNTWEAAEKYCESIGGHLAVINDYEENKMVYDIMKEFGYKSTYFGLSDAGHQDDWRWVTGDPVEYTNWANGEPNHERGKEHYGMYYWKFKYTWNDGDFGKGTKRGGDAFICEWDGEFDKEATIKHDKIFWEKTETDSINNTEKTDYAEQVLSLVNQERQKVGVAPLKLSDELMEAAAIRADEITVLMSHTRPNGKPCQSLIENGEYTVGENIAAGVATSEEVVKLWMNSPDHRANILNADYEELGVGHVQKNNMKYEHYWVQMFKRPMHKAMR